MTGFFWSPTALMRSRLLRALVGVTVRPSTSAPIGKPIRAIPGVLVAHPLDIIAIEHRNPHDRLDAAGTWITEQIDDRFDRATNRITNTDAAATDRMTIAVDGAIARIRRQQFLWEQAHRRLDDDARTGRSLHGYGMAVDIAREPWHFTFPAHVGMSVKEAGTVLRHLGKDKK